MAKIEIIAFEPHTTIKIPLFSMSVSAGVPVPVDNEVENMIDLNEYLVKHPRATFFAKVSDDNCEMAGIQSGDILIVDTAIEAIDGKIVLAVINEEITIKYYRNINDVEYLESANGTFFPMSIGDEHKYKLLGVVTNIIHSL